MKTLLKLEELFLLVFSVFFAYAMLPYAWWWYWALFLLPDIGMVGYLVNTQVGAVTYNLTHHKGVAVLCFVIGYMTTSEPIVFAGFLLLGHSSFDRILGYGLKYNDNFKNTHLGWIGGAKPGPA